MDSLFDDFRRAQNEGNGPLLAATLTPAAPPSDPNRLPNFRRASAPSQVHSDVRYAIVYDQRLKLPKAEANAWVDVYVAFWKLTDKLFEVEQLTAQGRPDEASWAGVYDGWKDVVNALIRGYSSGAFAAWTIPCLYVAGKYLRVFAMKADEQTARTASGDEFAGFQDEAVEEEGKNEKLEDAARQINRIFSLCINDREPDLAESRKWGVYYTINLLFKTYFKLNNISLAKNILRSLQATTTDMPPLSSFPKPQIVTFEYYLGVIFFLEENYPLAEQHLTTALRLCHHASTHNRELILTYLIPCRLLTTRTLPSAALLRPHARLNSLLAPLMACIRRGDLAGFDAALAAGQDEFIRRRVYLTLERGRDVALRNLFRKVFVAAGDDEKGVKKVYVPVGEFAAAISLRSAEGEGVLDRDEVECLIANMIYKGYIKGYIHRERGLVVFSRKNDAFPGTGI